MAEKSRITYTEWNEPQVVCVPSGGFPLERLRGYVEMGRAKRSFGPDQIRDLIGLLCDETLIDSLEPPEQAFVRDELRPHVNAFIQPRARAIREARKQN